MVGWDWGGKVYFFLGENVVSAFPLLLRERDTRSFSERVETDAGGIKGQAQRLDGGIGADSALLRVKEPRLEFRAKLATHNYLVLFYLFSPSA